MILLFCSIQGIVFQLDMYRSSILFCEIGMPVVTHFIIILFSVYWEVIISVVTSANGIYAWARHSQTLQSVLLAHKAKFVLAELSVTRGGVWG